MKIKWKTLLICIAIPFAMGGIAAFISKNGMSVFESLNKPSLSPPGWIFPVAWTTLYILMGIAAYLILTSEAPSKNVEKAIKLYAFQLFFNFLWTFWFFNLGLYFFAFIWLLALWVLIIATIVCFSRVSRTAAYLIYPYLLWVTFAGYLNLGIAILNK